jgi:Spy/CpxP family protein refolding chaperone
MRTKILSIIVLMSLSIAVFAQKTENGPKNSMRGQDHKMIQGERKGPAGGLNLTDQQKESFKQIMMEMQKQMQPLRNQVGEAVAHQKTLVTAEKPDISAVNKNIEKIGELRIEMAKIKAKSHLDMRVQLTDEQRFKFDIQKRRMGLEKAEKRSRGMKQNHPMI